MAQSFTDELTLIEAAIVKALNGQSYSVNGRSVQRPDLKTLFDRRDYLREMINRESSGYATVAVIDRPT